MPSRALLRLQIAAIGKLPRRPTQVERLEAALREQYGRELRLAVTVGKPERPTPAELRRANESARMREAREAIESDPNIKALQAAFEATLEPDSIRSSK